ncbi:hypothetical protein PIB30_086893 [Stylosanthes scabra]|uniref:Uncharacterized protein n=1 Tax=Stylosanthes scabra TaxID=79078 RepID=A0ABU6WT58_9FABA|nr:hypothetical protein [Stylosanthes scabra]
MDAILAENKAIAQQLTTLNNKLEKLEVAAMSTQAETATICDLCGGPHENQHCYLMMPDIHWRRQQQQPYEDLNANIYSFGWRNHPHFGSGGSQSPKNNHFQNHPPYQPFQPSPFPQTITLPPAPQPKPPQANFEAALEKLTMTTMEFVQTTTTFIEEARTNFRNQESGEALQDSKQEGLNKEDVKGTPTEPTKEEMVMNAIQYPEEDEEDWYMRIDVIEELNREVQQEDDMKKFQAKQGMYDVFDDTSAENRCR